MHKELMQSRIVYANINLKKILPVTWEYIQNQKEAGGLNSDFTTYKMLELFEILVEKMPKTIVEIGGGMTTSVFYEYSIKNCSYVRSFEEHEEYQKFTTSNIPEDNNIRFKIVPVERTDNECFFKFDWKSEPSYRLNGHDKYSVDFLYVDGPSNRIGKDGNYKFLPCTDFERMFEAGIFPKTIVFDMRFQSVEYLMNESKFGHFYKPVLSDLCSIGVPGQYHSIFTLREYVRFL